MSDLTPTPASPTQSNTRSAAPPSSRPARPHDNLSTRAATLGDLWSQGSAPQRDSPSTDTEDFMNPAEDVLQETQTQLTQIADAMEDATGVDRRQFVFMSLVAAAATTFGVDALRAQAAAS